MPFNDPEENQDKNAAPVTELEPDYPGGGPRLATNMSAGILPVGSPTRILLPGARSAFWQMRPQSPVRGQGSGHPITDMGQEQASPLGGAFSLGTGMRPPQRKEIGYRILGLNAEPAKSLMVGQPQSLPNANPQDWRTRLNSSHSAFLPQHDGLSGYGSFFNSFVPAGAVLQGGHTSHTEPAQPQSGSGVSQKLGRAAGVGMGSAAGSALATAARQSSANDIRNTPVVDVSNLVRARSRIHQAKPAPEVKPNLAVTGKNDKKQLNNTLQTLMKGMGSSQTIRQSQGQQDRLTPREREAAASVAYSETTNGSVEELEAIISVIVNRAASGQRQYVNPGQEVNVQNVVQGRVRLPHGRLGGYQFKGVGGNNQSHFAGRHDLGAQNARQAAAYIAQNGPTNNATAFMVTRGGEPSPDDVKAQGNVHFVRRVGNVFLYGPGVAPGSSHQGSPRRQPPQKTSRGSTRQ